MPTKAEIEAAKRLLADARACRYGGCTEYATVNECCLPHARSMAAYTLECSTREMEALAKVDGAAWSERARTTREIAQAIRALAEEAKVAA